MKATLAIRMGQQISLTPHLLRSIALLQLDATCLEQEIRRNLDSNPMLETVEAEDECDIETGPVAIEVAAERVSDHAWDAPGGSSALDDDPCARIVAGASSDMRVRLLEQFAYRACDPEDWPLAAFVLDHVDDSGYLESPPECLAAAAAAAGLDGDRLEAARQLLMRCEPEGIGARDLRECLGVQLAELPGPLPGRRLAQRLIAEHLDLLADHDPGRVARAMAIDPEQAAEAMALVLTLDPRPGQRLSPPAESVVPDVRVERCRGGWRVSLNRDCAPRVRVDPVHERLLSECRDGDCPAVLRDLLHQARWFSRGLATRHETLLRTVAAIVECQQAFLIHGERAMVPLTLKQIAEAIGVHESTVSRVVTGKYVQTPCGTLELKRFFAVRLQGSGVAGTAVRAMVRTLIEGENPTAPLTDDTIVVLLARQGVRVARRTVAKYRDMLRIAPARERLRGERAAARMAHAV